MTCRSENLRPEVRLLPEAQTHVDQRLAQLVNMALDVCANQISLHQTDLVPVGNPNTFFGYLKQLHSAINQHPSYLLREGGIDTRRNLYQARFVKDLQDQSSFLQPVNECRLVVSSQESNFDINYLLLVSNPSVKMFQQLAGVNIGLKNNGDSNISLKLYSPQACFQTKSLSVRNKMDDSPGKKAYKYLSTLKLSPASSELHSPFHQ